MSADCSTWTPMIGRPFSAGLSIVPTLTLRVAPPARTESLTVSPGLCLAISRRRSSGVFTGLPSTPTITSVASILPSAGAPPAHGDDERALRLGNDFVAELAERDRGGDLLRAVHLPQVLAAAFLIVRPRRDDCVLGNEVCAVGTGERQQLLEHRRLPHDHVDVEDLAGRMRLLALDLHEAARAASRCPGGGDSCRRGTATPRRRRSGRARSRADEPKRLHSRLRVRPPSTPIVVPET